MIKIVDKVDCCGCEACSNICPNNCIEMKEDSEGFLYPRVDIISCTDCGACERVCPINAKHSKEDNKLHSAFVVQHKDRQILQQSTAGGAFSAIAEYVIERNGIVYGVEMREDYFVCHTGVETKADLIKFRNSKYVQSNIGLLYRQIKKHLRDGKLVCFSGTPCQIEGLRHYLARDYDNLILVDVVCRAVPSPGIWKKYIEMECRHKGEIQAVRFRDKGMGYQYSTMTLQVDNHIYRAGIESQPWLRMFFSGMIIRPSCTNCKFRSASRNSDFTIWDCFNIHNIDKSFNEDAGTTRVLVQSEKGKEIFQNIKSQLVYKEIGVNEAIQGVHEMEESPQVPLNREEFWDDMNNMPIEEVICKYFPQSTKVMVKKYLRLILNKVGLDKKIKHILKKG